MWPFWPFPDVSRELTADAGRSLQKRLGGRPLVAPEQCDHDGGRYKPRGGIKEMAAKKAMPKKKAKKK